MHRLVAAWFLKEKVKMTKGRVYRISTASLDGTLVMKSSTSIANSVLLITLDKAVIHLLFERLKENAANEVVHLHSAYGVVCAVFDETAQRTFAVKKCRDIFHSRTIAKRTLREIRLLSFLRHENVSSCGGLCLSYANFGFSDC